MDNSYIRVHHIRYVVPVLGEGETDLFTKVSKIRKNTQILSGKIPCSLGDATVTLLRVYSTESQTDPIQFRLCIYLPHMFLKDEETPQFEKFGKALCREVLETLREKEWSLGEPFLDNTWIPHFSLKITLSEAFESQDMGGGACGI